MAKRFTDSVKWDKGSFMALAPRMKLAWVYLCDKCDHAGVWDINLTLMSTQVGDAYFLDELVAGLGDRVRLLSSSKLLLVDFVLFQYGELNPTNRVHLSVIKTLERVGASKPLPGPSQGAKDKDKDTYKEKDKDQEGECEGDFPVSAIVPPSATPYRPTFTKALNPDFEAQILEGCEIYRETLRFFGQGRSLLETEKVSIARAIQQHGALAVKLALAGARFEPKGDRFNPADWVDLNRYLDAKNFKRMLGYGVKKTHESEEAS